MSGPTARGIPTLQTERLTLRAHRHEDLDAYAALWVDPAVTRYTSGRPFSREEAWIRILRYGGHWGFLGYGFWVIEERASGRLVGETGFHDLKRGLTPSIEGTPEAGWMLAPDLHGQGYAREAVTAIHAWGDRHFDTGSTVCIIHPDNAASLRVAEACGYLRETLTTYLGDPTIILRRTSPRG